jgi:hypothetical protein
MNVTPLHLLLMIHYHAVAEEVPNKDAPAVIEYTNQLASHGLIIGSFSSPSGYRSTARGAKWLQMLEETPLPENEWTDPRKFSHE